MAALQIHNSVYRLIFWHNQRQHSLNIVDSIVSFASFISSAWIAIGSRRLTNCRQSTRNSAWDTKREPSDRPLRRLCPLSRPHTAATVEKMFCFKSMAIMCSAFFRRTLANVWTTCWTAILRALSHRRARESGQFELIHLPVI